jgi:predicted RNA-binding protein with PUA-like domain
MHWLLKSEPDSYGWDDLVRDGGTEWDGVRNHAAAGHLKRMSIGELALVYHSGKARAAIGIARIARAVQADGDPADGWVSVRIEPVEPLPAPVTLAAMKAEPALADMAMLRQSRLSVSPVTDAEWAVITRLATS